IAATDQCQALAEMSPGQAYLPLQERHLRQGQANLRLDALHAPVLGLLQLPGQRLQRRTRLVLVDLGQHQQILEPWNQLQGGRRRLYRVRPAIVAQHPGQRFIRQFGT
ncbi:conserved hypothetical protein, partial [Ricinus communis]